MWWLILLCLICPFVMEQTTGRILNKTVPVPDNDKTLQQIVYRSGLQYTNSKLPSSETNWWVPVPGQSLRATTVRTYDKHTKKYYATYRFFVTTARSVCKKNVVPLSDLKNCSLEIPVTQYQKCDLVFAWYENEWSTTEIEGTVALIKQQ